MPDFQAPWHEIPRQEIPWFPMVHPETCIACTLCFATCGRNVYDFDYDQPVAVVDDAYNCVVGCSTCGAVCPRCNHVPQRRSHPPYRKGTTAGRIHKSGAISYRHRRADTR
jgi:MinD superfamily P-loop ATPase